MVPKRNPGFLPELRFRFRRPLRLLQTRRPVAVEAEEDGVATRRLAARRQAVVAAAAEAEVEAVAVLRQRLWRRHSPWRSLICA
jgi:hypothetical protein